MNADNLVVPALAHGSIAVEAMPFGRFCQFRTSSRQFATLA
jgi:hypothetical protein